MELASFINELFRLSFNPLMCGRQLYLQITPYLTVPRKRSPDGATTKCVLGHLVAACYYGSIREDERVSRPSSLTCSKRFIHISSHPADAILVQDRESAPVKRPTFDHRAIQSFRVSRNIYFPAALSRHSTVFRQLCFYLLRASPATSEVHVCKSYLLRLHSGAMWLYV